MTSEYELLYRISTEGFSALDAISTSQQKIALETKYSADALRQFDSLLRAMVSGGASYSAAIKQMSSATGEFGKVAQDVIRNEQILQRELQASERAAQRLADSETRAALQRQRASEQVRREIERTSAANQRAAEQAAAQASRQERQAIGGIARGLGVPGGFALSSGSMAMAGAAGLAIAGRGIFDMVKDAAQGARELQNLADEFGITTNEAFQFQAAARLAGVEIGTMAQAARRLSLAIEEPGGAGKQTAEAMTKLGVSLRQGPGEALVDVIHKLNEMHDTAARDALAAELLGRSFVPLLNAGKELDSVGVSMDRNITERLLKAQRTLADFENKWTVAKAGLAAGVIIPIALDFKGFAETITGTTLATSIWSSVSGTVGGWRDSIMKGLGTGGGVGMPSAGPSQGHASALNTSALDRALRGTGKLSLDEQVEAAKKAYETELVSAANVRATGGSQSALDTEAQKVTRLRAEYERLEAAKKAAARNPNTASDEITALAMRDTGPLQEEMLRRAKLSRDYPGDSRIGPAYAEGIQNILGRYSQQAAKSAQEEATRNQKALSEAGWSLPTWMVPGMTAAAPASDLPQTRLFQENLRRTIRDQEEQAAEDKRRAELARQNVQLNLGYQTSTAQRSSAANLALSSDKSPAENYTAAIDLANQLLGIRQKDIALEDDSDKRSLAAKRALYEYMEQQDQAHITRMEQAKAIDDQQKQETASFFVGWFDAAISHRPSAVTNYLSGFGRKTVDQMLGNFFTSGHGGSLQGFVGLGNTGLLGTPDNRSFLGDLVKGTPLDFSAKQYGGKADPLRDATDKNTDATIANTAAMAGLLKMAGVDTSTISMSGGGFNASSLASSLMSPARGAMSIVQAARSGNPAAIIEAAKNATVPLADWFGHRKSSFLGGDTGDFPLPWPTNSLPPGFDTLPSGLDSSDLSASISPSGFPSFGDVASISPSGATMPDLGFSFGSGTSGVGPGATPSLPPGFPSTPNISGADASTLNLPFASSGLSDLGKIASMGMPSSTDRTGDVKGASKTASTLSQLMGGAQIAGSGYGVQDIWAKITDPNSTNITTPQAFGAGLAMAGQAAAGIMQAVTGFQKGGARGDIQGIAGAAMAVAPFTGPAAPFIEAGATIMDMVSSLFPDPRQERIKQEQETLLQKAFIQPARHDYSFSSTGSGGFAMGEGGVASGGGDVTHNHTWNVQAIDAQSFIKFMQDNPTAAEAVVETGMTSGSQSSVANAMAYVSQNGGW